jgi:hypothetical protein
MIYLALLLGCGVGGSLIVPGVDTAAEDTDTDTTDTTDSDDTNTGNTNTGNTNTTPIIVQELVVEMGSTWGFSDQGALGADWKDADFDDSGWASGPAPLGYGDPHIVTQVDFGNDPNDKRRTTYFRQSFEVTGVALSADIGLMRDDGAVVYLNGVEVARDNMPEGAIDFDTRAIDDNFDELTYYPFEVDETQLVVGTNVIAVEVHQATRDSSDQSLDVWLEISREE